MIQWVAYPNGAGAWCEINGLRLVAMEDGSWWVQDLSHKQPAMHSPTQGLRVLREWTLETAKEQAEQAAKLMAA